MTVWKGWCRVAGGEKGSPRPPPRPSVPQSIRASEAACPHVMMTNMPVSRALSGFDNLAFQLRRLTFKVRLSGKTWNSQLQTVRRRWYLQVEGKKKKLTTGSICHLTTIKTIFSEQDIFVKVLRSPKIRYRAEGVSLKAGKKKKFAVCFFTKNDCCNHLEFSASCGGFAQNMFIERTRRRLGGFRVVKFRTLQKTSQILLSWCFLLYCKHGISKKKTSVVWSRNTDTSAMKKGKVKHLLVLNNMEVGKCSWRPGSETCCSI